MYSNLKAQKWWLARMMFENTYRALNNLSYDKDMLISISSEMPNMNQLKRELAQAQYSNNTRGQLVIDKAPKGQKSPNIADALIISLRVPKKIINLSSVATTNSPKWK